jgi:hypothetical protein
MADTSEGLEPRRSTTRKPPTSSKRSFVQPRARDMATTTTPKERVGEFFENYLLALTAIDRCPAIARKAIKVGLTENADQADRALGRAIADGLKKNSRSVESAVKNLAEANRTARDALRGDQAIAKILGFLQQTTQFASGVLAVSA